MSSFWERFKKRLGFNKDKNDTSKSSTGQGQYEVKPKQHSYDEIEIGNNQEEQKGADGSDQYKVEKKQRQYEDIEIDNDNSATIQRSDNQLNYIDVEITGKNPVHPKVSLEESKAAAVNYSEVIVN